MRFDDKNFEDDKKYPSREAPQWKCLYSLIKKQPGTCKVTNLAKIAGCAVCTITTALEKDLEKRPNILSPKIAMRLAEKLKNPKLLGKLCPQYKGMEKLLK